MTNYDIITWNQPPVHLTSDKWGHAHSGFYPGPAHGQCREVPWRAGAAPRPANSSYKEGAGAGPQPADCASWGWNTTQDCTKLCTKPGGHRTGKLFELKLIFHKSVIIVESQSLQTHWHRDHCSAWNSQSPTRSIRLGFGLSELVMKVCCPICELEKIALMPEIRP